MERSSVNLESLKDIPGYRVILKTVLHSQIQQLAEQLSKHTEEEVVFLTASLGDGTISHFGSRVGKEFLHGNDEVKSRFLAFCLKRQHEISTNQQSTLPTLTKAPGQGSVPLKITASSTSASHRHSPYTASSARQRNNKRQSKTIRSDQFHNDSTETVTNENDRKILETVSIELVQDDDDDDDADDCDVTDNEGLSDDLDDSGQKLNQITIKNVRGHFQSKGDSDTMGSNNHGNLEAFIPDSNVKVESVHASRSSEVVAGSGFQFGGGLDPSSGLYASSQSVGGASGSHIDIQDNGMEAVSIVLAKDANPHIKAKYRQYSLLDLASAYKCVIEDGVSVKRAAALHGVPVQTLRDRVKKKIGVECVSSGRSPVLDTYEEGKIVEHVKFMAELGYSYTMQEIAHIATDYAVILGKRTYGNPLTLKWMDGFRKRWPEIKVSKPRNLDHVRAKMTSETSINLYFENLQKALIKYDILDKPHRIFNVDEKEIAVVHKPPHTVSCADESLADTTDQAINILGGGSAGGVAIPPYFVFPGKRMLPDLLAGSTPGTAGTVTDTGCSNGLVFRDYLQDHFVKFVPEGNNEPVLLLLDGHKSHVSVGLTEWALQYNIIIFVLPAHTSHLLQPMDFAVGELEKIYNTLCDTVVTSTSPTISRYNVCELACKAYIQALSSDNLLSAYEKTGIHPFEKEAIDKAKEKNICLYPVSGQKK